MICVSLSFFTLTDKYGVVQANIKVKNFEGYIDGRSFFLTARLVSILRSDYFIKLTLR